MSGELEAAGALATAGAVAGAIEGREPTASGEGVCLNCGAKLEGRFCSQCGQASHPHRKLTEVFDEFLHGLFHLDTKTWRTLPMVVFRPGTLTRNYVYGKRARYLSPLTMFLFSIFLMFFVFSFFDPPAETNVVVRDPAAAANELTRAREELRQAQADLAEARANPASDEPAGLETTLAEGAVRMAEAHVQRLEERLAQDQATANPATPPTAPAESQPQSGDDEDDWRDVMRGVAQSEDFVVVDGMPALNARVRSAFANPDLTLFRIQEAASKFSFLLAPLSLPFIALMFLWKRGLTFYDHMAFALYALSFASLLFIAMTLAAQLRWTSWATPLLVLFGLPLHTFFHFKGAYALGWFSALWRTVFMLVFATFIIIIFLVLIVIVGLVG